MGISIDHLDFQGMFTETICCTDDAHSILGLFMISDSILKRSVGKGNWFKCWVRFEEKVYGTIESRPPTSGDYCAL